MSLPVKPIADFFLTLAQHSHHCHKSWMGFHVWIVLKTLQRKRTKLNESAQRSETTIHMISRSKQGRGEIPALLTSARSKVYFFTKSSNSGIRVLMPSNTCSTKRDMEKTRFQQTLWEGKCEIRKHNYKPWAWMEVQCEATLMISLLFTLTTTALVQFFFSLLLCPLVISPGFLSRTKHITAPNTVSWWHSSWSCSQHCSRTRTTARTFPQL